MGQFKFPIGEAASHRTKNIARSLKKIGHDVLFCTGQLSHFISNYDDKETDKFFIQYINYSKKPVSKIRKIFKFILSGYRTLQWIKNLSPKPDLLILYGGYTFYMVFLSSWCRRNSVSIIIDVVEWYEPSHMLGGKFGPLRWNTEIAMRYYFIKARNIIAISSYLANYYQNNHCLTLRIPPTLDVKSIEARIVVSKKRSLTLAYSGFAGKKDLINNILEAILKLDPSGNKVKIIVVGSDQKQVLQLPSINKKGYIKLPKCIKTMGILSQKQAIEIVKNADFSVLIRPPMRYAQAGFPTKVTESLSVGTPVICNLTSDLEYYIHDLIEGLICRDHSVEAFSEALQRALSLTTTELTAMRHAARAQAERSFDYRNYNEPLNNFIDKVCSQNNE